MCIYRWFALIPPWAALSVNKGGARSGPYSASASVNVEVNRLDLHIAPADWCILQTDLRTPDAVHVFCTLKYSNVECNHLAIFTIRNTSLALTLQSGRCKLLSGLRCDEPGDQCADAQTPRFYGFCALADGRLADSAFHRLFIDFGHGAAYFGLYTIVEVPVAPFLDARFGDSAGSFHQALSSGTARQRSGGETAVSSTNAPPGSAFDVDGFHSWLKGYAFLRDASVLELSIAEILEPLNRRQNAVKRALAGG